MKKGFTLVELLAVIVVLGLLITLVSPKLLGVFDENSDRLYNNTILEIERFAKLYLIDNADLYFEIDENGYVDIQMSNLCDSKLLSCPVIDPKDDSEINGYVRVTKDSSNENKYIYKFERE